MQMKKNFEVSSFIQARWKLEVGRWEEEKEKEDLFESSVPSTRSSFSPQCRNARAWVLSRGAQARAKACRRVCMPRRRLIDRFCHRFLLPAYRVVSSLTR